MKKEKSLMIGLIFTLTLLACGSPQILPTPVPSPENAEIPASTKGADPVLTETPIVLNDGTLRSQAMSGLCVKAA